MKELFPYFDVMSIPDAMADPYAAMFALAWILLPGVFMLATVASQAGGLATPDGNINWKGFFVNLIFCVVGLTLSKFIFLKIVALSEVIASLTISSDELLSFTAGLITKNQDLAFSGGIVSFFKSINKMWVLGVTGSVIMMAEICFLFLRYALLSILYVISPLCFILAIFKPTRSALKGWFSNVFQISFWIVFLRISERVILSLNLNLAAKEVGILETSLINVFYIGVIILTPVITSKILSGEHLGTVGSLAMAAGTATLSKMGKAGSHIGAGAKKAKSGAADMLLGKRTPSQMERMNTPGARPEGGGAVGAAKSGVAAIQQRLKKASNLPPNKSRPRR